MTGNPFDRMWGEDSPVFLGRAGHLRALFESCAAAVAADIPVSPSGWGAVTVPCG
jgi:hypothetical protein